MFFVFLICIKFFADTFYSDNTTGATDLILASSTLLLLMITIGSIWFSYREYKIRNALEFEKNFLANESFKDSFKHVTKYLRLLEEDEVSLEECCIGNKLRTYECECCAKLNHTIISDDTKKHIMNILNHWDCYANGVYTHMQDNSVMYNTFGAIYVRHFFRLLPYIIQSQTSSLAHYQGAIWLAFRWFQELEVRELENTISLVVANDRNKRIDFSRYQHMLKDAKTIQKNAKKTIDFHSKKRSILNMMQSDEARYKKYNQQRIKLIDSLIEFRKTYCLSRSSTYNNNQQLDCVLEKIPTITAQELMV